MNSIIYHPLANRNLREDLKLIPNDAIKQRTDRLPFSVCCFPTKYGGNTAAILRTFSCFNGTEFITVGYKKFVPMAAVGAQYYENIVHLSNEFALLEHIRVRGYSPICIDKTRTSTPISNKWPEKPLFIFGKEADGIPSLVLHTIKDHRHIPMYGPIRSFNVSIAAAITMYAYCCEYKNVH